MVEAARALILVEAKSGATVADDFFAGLDSSAKLVARVEPQRITQKVLIYGGEGGRVVNGTQVVPWSKIQSVVWADED